MNTKKKAGIAICLLGAFALWTYLVCRVDIQAIGPWESAVGFGTVNGFFHRLTGVHMALYTLTDWLGLVPVGVGAGFGLLGLCQWIRRKSICRVDGSILLLGGYYIAVLAMYLLFETVVINYRPVLIAGFLESSYPSSTTLLVLCVMPTAAMQLRSRIGNKKLNRCVTWLTAGFTLFMVVGRLVSGVHWLSDIIGGVLLSGGLVMLYSAFSGHKKA